MIGIKIMKTYWIFRFLVTAYTISTHIKSMHGVLCIEKMAEREEKCYKNPYEDKPKNDKIISRSGHLQGDFTKHIKDVSDSMLKELQYSLRHDSSDDYSVYTGSCGIAFLYFLIGNSQKNPEYFEKALHIVENTLPRLKKRRVSFLNGDAGPLSLGAVLYHQLGKRNESEKMIGRVEEMLASVTATGTDLPDEVLYGRAGYLYSLLFINKHVGENAVDSKVIKKVVSAILKSGRELAEVEKKHVPLLYKWHDKFYVGAAHGMAGIMYMLLQARKHMKSSDLESLVHPTIDYLQKLAFPSGNFPSSLGNKSDRLVQWCHGAPGLVDMFILAHEVFGDESYLQTALSCGEVVWKSGILKKSYGICHGVCGNGYTFISLYKTTKDPIQLYRTMKFSEWCTTYGKYQTRSPDRPLSLFEGVAGAIYFLIDSLNPGNASFPAYSL